MILKRIGDKVRNHGMMFTLDSVDITSKGRPVYFLKRDFDGSVWYTNSAFVTRFTNLKRLYDRRHAYLDKYDVMAGMNEVMRRL